MMEITIKTIEEITVAEITGDIDGKTAPQIQKQISPLVQPNCKIILDMTKVDYLSSAGLRLMLTTHRHVCGNNGQVLLAGVSEEIQETMSATGFLRFLTLYDTVEAALATLKE
jgi:anti-sigma B factor antagonist